MGQVWRVALQRKIRDCSQSTHSQLFHDPDLFCFPYKSIQFAFWNAHLISKVFNLQISKRNDIIRRLKNDIYVVEKNAEEQSRRIITDAAKQDAAEMKNSDSKKSKLQQEIIELKKKLEGDTVGHRESELALRKVGV